MLNGFSTVTPKTRFVFELLIFCNVAEVNEISGVVSAASSRSDSAQGREHTEVCDRHEHCPGVKWQA
jgi:hypothetical protein